MLIEKMIIDAQVVADIPSLTCQGAKCHHPKVRVCHYSIFSPEGEINVKDIVLGFFFLGKSRSFDKASQDLHGNLLKKC